MIAAYHLRAPALFAYGTGLSKRTASLSSCAYIVPFSSRACAGAKSSAWWRSAVASKTSCDNPESKPQAASPLIFLGSTLGPWNPTLNFARRELKIQIPNGSIRGRAHPE